MVAHDNTGIEGKWIHTDGLYTSNIAEKAGNQKSICAYKEVGKTKRRSRSQAEKSGELAQMPEKLAIPTLGQYKYALTTIENPNAYLQPVKEFLSGLYFKDGGLYLSGMDAGLIDLQQHYDRNPKSASNLELPMLRCLYSIILQDVEKTGITLEKARSLLDDPGYIGHGIRLYLPDLLKMMGYIPGTGSQMENAIVNKINACSNILGVIVECKGGQAKKRHYPVIQELVYDAADNTVSFSSPYINKIIMHILHDSIQTDRKGSEKKSNSEKPFRYPCHSYLIKPGIAKQKNKKAVEIVCIVVTLVEQAGKNVPHIKFRTIIERCPELYYALESANTTANKNNILRRAFSKAWELLPEFTTLTEAYTDIKLPEVSSEYVPLFSFERRNFFAL